MRQVRLGIGLAWSLGLLVLSLTAGAQPIASAPAGVTLRPTVAVSTVASLAGPSRSTGTAAQPAPGRRRMAGAMLGIVLGGVAGWAITSTACDRCDDPAPIVAGAGLGAAVGGILGALIELPPAARGSRSARTALVDSPPRLLPNMALQLTERPASGCVAGKSVFTQASSRLECRGSAVELGR